MALMQKFCPWRFHSDNEDCFGEPPPGRSVVRFQERQRRRPRNLPQQVLRSRPYRPPIATHGCHWVPPSVILLLCLRRSRGAVVEGATWFNLGLGDTLDWGLMGASSTTASPSLMPSRVAAPGRMNLGL